MSERRIIAVAGATGAQGGGLVSAILKDRSGQFTARALTRDVHSPKARALADQGVEVVHADLDDAESLKRAFAGAWGAYCVTFYWAHMSPQRETENGRALARAAQHAGVRHAIWSTFEDTRDWVPLSDSRMPTIMGGYKVPHFDSKAEVDPYFNELGVPTTFLYTSFYWDNMIRPGAGPQRGADGRLALTFCLGNARMPGINSADIGACALGIFKRSDEFIGHTLGVAGEHVSGARMAAGLTRALGEEVVYNDVPPDVYRSFGFPGADDTGNMLQFYRDFEADFRAMRSVELSKLLHPGLQSYDQWLADNAARIPLR